MSTERPSLISRARVHAALGDTGRLAIVDLLTLGDAAPGEIGTRLDMPTNLVAHHLNVLDDAGVVERSRSSGDRRRTYVRLRPEALTGGAPDLAPGPTDAPGRILFVCYQNAARSQLAAAAWRRDSGVPAASAGIRPADRVHPRAVALARKHRLRIGSRPALLDDVVRDGDLLVVVCDRTHETLHGHTGRLHWSVPPPRDTAADYEATFRDLSARIGRLASALPRRRTPYRKTRRGTT